MALRPKRVIQAADEMCWAACMEAWTEAAWYWQKVEQGIFAMYYGTGANYGLDPSGSKYQNLLYNWYMNDRVVGSGQMSPGAVRSWLWMGYFMIIFKTGPKTSHAMLAYDITSGDDLRVMDPNKDGGFRTGSLNSLPGDLLIVKIDTNRL